MKTFGNVYDSWTMGKIRIGEWTVDTTDGTMRSSSRVERLEPRVIAVLLALAEEPGVVVPQDVLMRRVWGGTHVVAGALARTISLLRRALGDDRREPRYIETVPKRGYRLVATVESLATAPPPAARPTVLWPLVRHVALAAAVLVVALIAPFPDTGTSKTRPLDDAIESRFTNQTRAGNENALDHYLQAIALAPASADAHAGLATAYAFRANYFPDRSRWTALALNAAARATTLDATNLRAVHALAVAHFQAGRLRDAVHYYQRTLELCPHDHAARADLGSVQLISGRIADALPLFEQYIAALPDSVDGYSYLAQGLVTAGAFREAGDVARLALVLEPNALKAQLVLVEIDLLDARYSEARARLERLREVYPECAQCAVQLGIVDQVTGNAAGAVVRYRAAREMTPSFSPASLRLAQVLMSRGKSVEAAALIDEVEREAQAAIDAGTEFSQPRWRRAAAAAVRGDRRSAIAWYRRAIDAGRRDAAWDRWDPLLAALRSDPEFIALHEAVAGERDAVAESVRRVPALVAGFRGR